MVPKTRPSNNSSSPSGQAITRADTKWSPALGDRAPLLQFTLDPLHGGAKSLFDPAQSAVNRPGAPSRESTQTPLSSESAGIPVARTPHGP